MLAIRGVEFVKTTGSGRLHTEIDMKYVTYMLMTIIHKCKAKAKYGICGSALLVHLGFKLQ